MSFLEFIGFIVTVGAMIFVIIRQAWENYQRKDRSEVGEPQSKEVLRDFLKSLDVDLDSEEPVKPKPKPKPQPKPVPNVPKKIVVDESSYQASLDSYHKKIGVEGRKHQQPVVKRDAYSLIRHEGVPRGRKIIEGLKSPQEMFILHTILGPPKGFGGK